MASEFEETDHQPPQTKMPSNKVIVFGPTGNIASVAAKTAQEEGAKVYLAMRDPTKSIQGLSADEEKAGGFERVKADMTQPDTVTAAIKETGAKSAFFYVAHGMPDHMKSTLQALKNAGVEFVVFLSSFTIADRPLQDIEASDIIPYIHAQVEINLEEVYGPDAYVAVRPGAFATNTLFWKSGIAAGEVKVHAPDGLFDYITPNDMGVVSGKILAKGKQDGEKIVYLFGPEMVSQRQAALTIGKALGKEIKVTALDQEGSIQMYMTGGRMPPVVAKYLTERLGDLEKGLDSRAVHPAYKKGVENIPEYAGRPSTTFEEWAKNNTQLFA